MVRFNVRWKLAEDFNFLRGASVLTKVQYFWRKGWIEVPVIMAGSFGTALGLAMVGYVLYYGSTHDMTPKFYKLPRVYRPDDPAVQRIRRTSAFDM